MLLKCEYSKAFAISLINDKPDAKSKPKTPKSQIKKNGEGNLASEMY